METEEQSSLDNVPSSQGSSVPNRHSTTASKRAIHIPEWMPNAVAMVTAIASLLLSLYTLVITTSQPNLLLIMPKQVRITQGGNSGPLLYLQPTFISSGLSEQAEVITDIRVRVGAMESGSEEIAFVWDEQGEWMVDPNSMLFNWVFTGDAGPFLVSARNAEAFTGLFIGPREWIFEPGRYRITLTADRITNAQPLVADVEVVLAAEELQYINQSQGAQFLIFPVEP
jgi:hypothetical protein